MSEHAVRGRRGALELHAVFRNASIGRLAVIGQIFDIGEENEFLTSLLADGAPLRVGDIIESPRAINVADAFEDTRSYYTYEGSLTTPPCSEIVAWFVLRERASASRAQYDAVSRATGNNFRPFQALNGRVVRATPVLAPRE